jgi:hypothetical protein
MCNNACALGANATLGLDAPVAAVPARCDSQRAPDDVDLAHHGIGCSSRVGTRWTPPPRAGAGDAPACEGCRELSGPVVRLRPDCSGYLPCIGSFQVSPPSGDCRLQPGGGISGTSVKTQNQDCCLTNKLDLGCCLTNTQNQDCRLARRRPACRGCAAAGLFLL